MSKQNRRWTVQDRYGNQIYLTQERWEHIIEDLNHPEMEEYEEELKTTIQKGRRRQEVLNPRKYRYYHPFDDLPEDTNHTIAIVLFKFGMNGGRPNSYIVTAFFQHIRRKR